MLRLSSDRILIALAPDSLALLRISGVVRPRVGEKRTIACDPALGAEPWQGAVAALVQLAGETRDANAEVTVVLSNHFARFIPVPWSEGLGNAEEQTAFVRYCFAKVHGERSKDWDLRLSSGPAGSTRIASAVDSSLVQAVRAAFPAAARAKLVSVQPYLMSAFNRWRKHLKGERAWFLLVEPQRACLARLEGGLLSAVLNTRGNFEEPGRWAELLDRERHRVGGEGTSEGVYVHAPRNGKTPPAEAEGWTFRSLALAPAEGLPPAEAEPYAMALCAL
ncbi:MAG TPA: hypothetical protein VK643_10725 [Burkholderiales bacterium]|nr:hypothetical protein [Burkholderiales bacterium]